MFKKFQGLRKILKGQGRINWTQGPGQSRDREVPETLNATAQRFTCPRFNFAEAPVRNDTSKLIENLKLAAKFRLIHLIVAIKVYLPVTALVSCSDELAVRWPLLCLQRQVAKLACGLFYYLCLLRNNNTAINFQTFTSSYGSRRFTARDHGFHCGVFPPRQARIYH